MQVGAFIIYCRAGRLEKTPRDGWAGWRRRHGMGGSLEKKNGGLEDRNQILWRWGSRREGETNFSNNKVKYNSFQGNLVYMAIMIIIIWIKLRMCVCPRSSLAMDIRANVYRFYNQFILQCAIFCLQYPTQKDALSCDRHKCITQIGIFRKKVKELR